MKTFLFISYLVLSSQIFSQTYKEILPAKPINPKEKLRAELYRTNNHNTQNNQLGIDSIFSLQTQKAIESSFDNGYLLVEQIDSLNGSYSHYENKTIFKYNKNKKLSRKFYYIDSAFVGQEWTIMMNKIE
jgi:hypothetical protein